MKEPETASSLEKSKGLLERRKVQRYPLYFPIEIQLDAHTWMNTFTVDISLGGARLRSKSPLPRPTIHFTLNTNIEGHITGEARVVWEKQMDDLPQVFIAGVEFLKFGNDGKERLESFLDKIRKYWKTSR